MNMKIEYEAEIRLQMNKNYIILNPLPSKAEVAPQLPPPAVPQPKRSAAAIRSQLYAAIAVAACQ